MIRKQYDPCRRATRLELTRFWPGCDNRYGFSLSDDGHTDWYLSPYLESRGWFEVLTPAGVEVECEQHHTDYLRVQQAADHLRLQQLALRKDLDEAKERLRDRATRRRIRELWQERPAPPKQVVKTSPAAAQGWARGYNWTWYRAMVRYERIA